ncbi:hypothetical protein FAM09_18335 [Niastella caeni]|uniref:Uncharacterized protein n=1 Tax=Niastella caeni TaxID=2569763 RepID=A0A4S8HUW5_9BACT|nr:hypothetical protein [Niastella caeni]THU36922.1 hypothetical protein FAM09_18335 [Niastella caeni]
MWILFVAMAAICNSMMDTVENENIYNSIFSHKDPFFWYKRVSWKYGRKIFSYKLDAWHLLKSAMIILLCAAAITYHYFPLFRSEIIWKSKWAWTADAIIFGIAWNLPFNLFYNKILRK